MRPRDGYRAKIAAFGGGVSVQTELWLGPLGSKTAPVFRSGMFWLCAEGQLLRPGEVFGFYNINVENRQSAGADAQAAERTRQVAVAAPIAGRLRIPQNTSSDGLLGIWPVRAWQPSEVVATLEVDGDAAGDKAPAMNLRLMVVAGRRAVWPVDSDASLLPGSNTQVRAWWSGTTPRKSLLCLGLCDVAGVVRGEHSAFTELFEAAPFACHVAHFSEHPVIPCTLVVLEQLQRSTTQRQAITADILAALSTGGANADDLSFASLLLRQLCAQPLTDGNTCLTEDGIIDIGPAQTVLLSLSSEPQSMLRHRSLGYHVYILSGDARAAGPAMRKWLKSSFEPVRRSTEDVRRDLVQLITSLRAATGGRIVVVNRMSTTGREQIYSYTAFASPLGDTLAYAAAKEMNVMLDDLAALGHLGVIDIDALAAEFGGEAHLPDGIHHSNLMQDALRRELLRHLAIG
jgi:hypothetical protein